jgi:putative tryptophan/tyrosine transport system substrate-binding protein
MRRRDFITILGGAAAAPVIRPSLVGAATSAKRRIIYIPYLFGSETGKTFTDAFVQGLQDLGYDLGRDLDLRFRDAGGDWDRYPALVKEEIVQLKPDVFYAFATVDAVAARKATSTIPIVCAALADAVRLGLIASDARPGGNVTGIAPYVVGLPRNKSSSHEKWCRVRARSGCLQIRRTRKQDPKSRSLKPQVERSV